MLQYYDKVPGNTPEREVCCWFSEVENDPSCPCQNAIYIEFFKIK